MAQALPDVPHIWGLALADGAYAIFAKTVPVAATPQKVDCKLTAGGVVDNASGETGETLTLQLTASLSASGATLECKSGPTGWSATDTSIIAIKLGSVFRGEIP